MRRRIERLKLQKLNQKQQYFEIIKKRYAEISRQDRVEELEQEILENEDQIRQEITKKIVEEQQDIKFFQKWRLIM